MSVYNSLFFRVVVRRTASGSRPFQWEIFKDGTVVPLQVSTQQYASMEAAHTIGQATLTAMLHQKQNRSLARRAGSRRPFNTPLAAAVI
jgi:hypothetical protein